VKELPQYKKNKIVSVASPPDKATKGQNFCVGKKNLLWVIQTIRQMTQECDPGGKN